VVLNVDVDKGRAMTMNYQKKGHRVSPYKSATHPSDAAQLSMDTDFDNTFPLEQDEIFSSQAVPTDSVKWQSSQLSSCAALNNLMLEIPGMFAGASYHNY
jgi:hypothetical protein